MRERGEEGLAKPAAPCPARLSWLGRSFSMLAPGSVASWDTAVAALRSLHGLRLRDAAGAEREKIHTSAFHAADSSISSSNAIPRLCWA